MELLSTNISKYVVTILPGNSCKLFDGIEWNKIFANYDRHERGAKEEKGNINRTIMLALVGLI